MSVDSTHFVPVIIGTAGHIDHGKSSLIKALTNTDPDRLKEEKVRGITIELGFAFLNDRIAFIDVPGHEKFVKHMVSGAATVDYVMLIVAADDGVMPQTIEHLNILTLLGVRGGLVVITKADLADHDLIELVREDIAELIENSVLQDAPIIIADSISGRGIEEVKQAVLKLAASKRINFGKGMFRMPIDRVFSMKGFGTVVTGSVLSGTVRVGDKLELLPKQNIVRIKGLQSQGKNTDRIIAGQRAAINLANISVEDISRGDTLTWPNTLKPASLMYAKVKILLSSPVPLKNRQRIHIHIGTADLLGRMILLNSSLIEQGEEGYVKLQLESQTAAQRFDRFIIRCYSPLITIGGGIILEAEPDTKRIKKNELLNMLVRFDSSDMTELVLAALDKAPFATSSDIALSITSPENDVREILEKMLLSGTILSFQSGAEQKFCSAALFQKFIETVRSELDHFHKCNPLRAGILQGELLSKVKKLIPAGTAHFVIDRAVAQGLLILPAPGLLALPEFKVQLTDREKKNIVQLEQMLETAKLTPPSVTELAHGLSLSVQYVLNLLTYLADTEKCLFLKDDLFFSVKSIDEARNKLIALFNKTDNLTVSQIRESLNSTRKYIIPLLEYFDTKGWTLRKQDVRLAGLKLGNLGTKKKRIGSGLNI